MKNASWEMWAVEDRIKSQGNEQDYFRFISNTERYCELQRSQYSSAKDKKCIPINVSLHEDQTPEEKTSGFGIDYWGWIEKGEDTPRLVQHAWCFFSMQFAGGSYGETEAGRGKAYRLKVKKL